MVDDLVDKLNFTCHRAEHLEQQLDRPFQKIDVLHVDWFSLEPTHHKTRVEPFCLLLSSIKGVCPFG